MPPPSSDSRRRPLVLVRGGRGHDGKRSRATAVPAGLSPPAAPAALCCSPGCGVKGIGASASSDLAARAARSCGLAGPPSADGRLLDAADRPPVSPARVADSAAATFASSRLRRTRAASVDSTRRTDARQLIPLPAFRDHPQCFRHSGSMHRVVRRESISSEPRTIARLVVHPLHHLVQADVAAAVRVHLPEEGAEGGDGFLPAQVPAASYRPAGQDSYRRRAHLAGTGAKISCRQAAAHVRATHESGRTLGAPP